MIIYIDMDDVLCDFTNAKKASLEALPEIAYPNSQYGFYQDLKPIPGALDAVEQLNRNPYYEVYILTAPSIHNPLSYTEKRIWVEENIGFQMVERLIISSNKGLLRGDILIDDNLHGHGQENFQGRLMHFGSKEFPDWKSVLVELETSIEKN